MVSFYSNSFLTASITSFELPIKILVLTKITGRFKNVYSSKGKIEALKIAYLKAKQEQSWNNYLAN